MTDITKCTGEKDWKVSPIDLDLRQVWYTQGYQDGRASRDGLRTALEAIHKGTADNGCCAHGMMDVLDINDLVSKAIAQDDAGA